METCLELIALGAFAICFEQVNLRILDIDSQHQELLNNSLKNLGDNFKPACEKLSRVKENYLFHSTHLVRYRALALWISCVICLGLMGHYEDVKMPCWLFYVIHFWLGGLIFEFVRSILRQRRRLRNIASTNVEKFLKEAKKLKDTFEGAMAYLIYRNPRTTLAAWAGMKDEEKRRFCELYNTKLTAFEKQHPGENIQFEKQYPDESIQVIDLLCATLDDLTAEAEKEHLFKGFERYIPNSDPLSFGHLSILKVCTYLAKWLQDKCKQKFKKCH